MTFLRIKWTQMSRTNTYGLFNSYNVSLANFFSFGFFMRQGRSAASHTKRVLRKTLEALIHALGHHEQSILWSLKVNNIRLALILSSFISKLLSRLRPCIRMNLDFPCHEIKDIINLVKDFTSSSFQRQLVLIVPFDFIKATLDIFLGDFKWHSLCLMEANIQLAQGCHTSRGLLRNPSLQGQLMQFHGIHFLSL